MSRLSISLGQMRIQLGRVEDNLETAERLIAGASERGSNLVMLPELWSTGYDLENALDYADALGEGMFAQMSTLSQSHGVDIYGSILERKNGKAMNCAAWHKADGKVAGVYRKVHLFRLFDEHLWLGEGESSCAPAMAWGAAGLAICYDLRFPELFRRYAVRDKAKLMLICAEWPQARVNHWRALLQARAIENQCFVAAANSCGETGGTVFGGNSMIIDPWGGIIAEAGADEALVTGEIDLSEVDRVRQTIPVFEDRRPEVYG